MSQRRFLPGRGLIAGLFALGCVTATTAEDNTAPLAWTVTDVSRHQRGAVITWEYTLTLQERQGEVLDLVEEIIGGEWEGVPIRNPTTIPFRRRVWPRETLRLRLWDQVTLPAAWNKPADYRISRRFIGRDLQGNPIVVDVQFSPASLE